jgi:peptidoglycan/xylan/chitin deacetylase (PgdA/CDA1 family)
MMIMRNKTILIIFIFLTLDISFSQEGQNYGGMIRTDKTKKEINLVFTAHEFADGAEIIYNTLKKYKIKASFFFTGDFYRNKKFFGIIKKFKKYGHYLGAHSDKHLLYAAWENQDSLLVTREEFINDLVANYTEMKKFGIKKNSAKYFLPPYEWYNQKIVDWCKELGIILVNFTPGTSSNADYTYPEMGRQYLSSDTIFNRILKYEQKDPYGLNGFILLIHFGSDPRRTDKFYNKLDELILELKKRGYKFKLLSEKIGNL